MMKTLAKRRAKFRHTNRGCCGRLGRRGSGNGPVNARRIVTARFDDCNRLERFRGNEEQCWSPRRNEWRETGRQDQSKSIERPGCCVIVVEIPDLGPLAFNGRSVNVIEMRVNDPGMIVIRPAGVNMLKRRDKERQQQCKACL